MKLIQGGLALAIVVCIAALDAYPLERKETLIALTVFATVLGVTLYLGRGSK